MVNPFLIPDNDGKEDGQPRDLQLATVAGIYSDGLSLIPDDQSEAMQKHYKYLSSAYQAPAVGDRVVIMKMSGTYIVVGALGGSASLPAANKVFAGPASGDPAAAAFRSLVAADLPVVPIEKGGTGQTAPSTGSDTSKITMASGFALDSISYTKWGRVITLTFSITPTQNTTTGDHVVGTLSDASMLPFDFVFLSPFTYSRAGHISSSGAITINGVLATGNTYWYSATYITQG